MRDRIAVLNARALGEIRWPVMPARAAIHMASIGTGVPLPASRAAFGIKASEAHLLPKILATVVPILDEIGRRTVCACERFHFVGRHETTDES